MRQFQRLAALGISLCLLLSMALAQSGEEDVSPVLRESELADSSLAVPFSLPGEEMEPEETPEPTPPPITVHSYSEGLAQAEQGDKWGFVRGDVNGDDMDGNIVIPIQYDSVLPFTLGMATVDLGGKFGVIRPDGKYLLQPEYDSLLPVGYGLYMAQRDRWWGVVSILPYTGSDGRSTNEIYPITYASVELGTSGGLEALILTSPGGGRTVTPLFQLPGMLSGLGMPGSQFPLARGRQVSFADVAAEEWYSLWVDVAYNIGIMAGTGGNLFEPGRVITVAEALQMAANMDSRYRGDTFHTTSHVSTPWNTDAVTYSLASSYIAPGAFDDYTRQISRRELAQVFAATSLAKSLPYRNSLKRVSESVGDVNAGETGADAIYGLYAKGILTGVDGTLSFRPDNPVSRAEAAALAVRLARPEQRVDLGL